MERVCFTFGLVPGAGPEYRRRHDEIWPEEVDVLRESGIVEYSIFLRGDDLYAFLTVAGSWDETLAYLKESEVQRRWAAAMSDLIAWQVDPDGSFALADEVFRFETHVAP